MLQDHKTMNLKESTSPTGYNAISFFIATTNELESILHETVHVVFPQLWVSRFIVTIDC